MFTLEEDPPKKKKPVTLPWLNSFAEQARKDNLLHLAALAIFLFGTGARRGEGCGVVWADVDLFNGKVEINQTKTKFRRTSHMQHEVIVAIGSIPSDQHKEELVFKYASGESVGKVWANVCKRAGIELLTPHCCRYGFATGMLRRGYDVKTVAKLGGWKDEVTVLKHYAHPNEDPTLTNALFYT